MGFQKGNKYSIGIEHANQRRDIDLRKNEVLSLYNSGVSIKEIAHKMGCNSFVIIRIIKNEGINIRPLKYYTTGKIAHNHIYLDDSKVIEMYSNGANVRDISNKFNVDGSVIYRILKENHITLHGKAQFKKGQIAWNKRNDIRNNFQEIFRLYKEELLSPKEIGKIMNCSTFVVYAMLNENKFKLNTSERRKLLMEKGKLNIWNRGLTSEKDSRILSGEKSGQWQGGLSFEPYTPDFNKTFKVAIKQRDGFLCLKCGMREEDSEVLFKRKLLIHHIDYTKENTIKENCCVLCLRCNTEVNSNRISWKKFFQSMLSERYGYKYDEYQNIILNLQEVKKCQ